MGDVLDSGKFAVSSAAELASSVADRALAAGQRVVDASSELASSARQRVMGTDNKPATVLP